MHGTYLLKTLQILTDVFDWLYITHCLTSFSFIDHLLHPCPQFFILFHLTYMRFSQSTHPLMFLSLETLPSIIRTGIPILGEMINLVKCYNFPTSNDLAQMVNFLTQIPDCDSHSPAFLDLFISSDASIYSARAFPPLGNCDPIVVSVSTDFPSSSQHDVPFDRIAYDYSCADWDGLCNHLRDFTWEDIFKLDASNIRSSLIHLHGFKLLGLLP